MGLQVLIMLSARNAMRQFNEKISKMRKIDIQNIEELRQEHALITRILITLNQTCNQYYFLYQALLIVLLVTIIYLLAVGGGTSSLIFLVWETFGSVFLLIIVIPPTMLNEECDKTPQLFFDREALPDQNEEYLLSSTKVNSEIMNF